MSYIPFYVLLLSAILFSNTALSSDSNESLDCDGLFSSLIEKEPYLKDELGALKSSCDLEQTTESGQYWSCIQDRMQGSDMSFDRFIVSANVCEGLT